MNLFCRLHKCADPWNTAASFTTSVQVTNGCVVAAMSMAVSNTVGGLHPVLQWSLGALGNGFKGVATITGVYAHTCVVQL